MAAVSRAQRPQITWQTVGKMSVTMTDTAIGPREPRRLPLLMSPDDLNLVDDRHDVVSLPRGVDHGVAFIPGPDLAAEDDRIAAGVHRHGPAIKTVAFESG